MSLYIHMKNDQRQYKFLEASWILMVFTFIGFLILNAFIVFKVQKTFDIPKNAFIGISMAALILIVPVLISRLVSFSKTTVTLDKKQIKVKRSSIIGIPIKSDFQLPYSQIQSYVFQNDQNWYWLKIKDSKGKVHRIWKFAHFKNKEFKAFRDRLTNEINWFNQEATKSNNIDSTNKQIIASDNIYQGTIGIILLIISVLIIVVIPIFLIVFGIPNLRVLGPGLMGVSGAIFTFFKVIHERKKKNTVANNGYK